MIGGSLQFVDLVHRLRHSKIQVWNEQYEDVIFVRSDILRGIGPLEIRLKISRLHHHYARLNRRLKAERYLAGFSKNCDIVEIRNLLQQLYSGEHKQ